MSEDTKPLSADVLAAIDDAPEPYNDMLTASERLEQNTEQWKIERLGDATASQYGAIVARRRDGKEAAARRNYRIQLALERILGHTPERFTFSNKHTDWGHETEAAAAVEAMLQHPEWNVSKIGYMKHLYLRAGASLDRVIEHRDTHDIYIMEIKCFDSANHYEALSTQRMPAEYRPQVRGQQAIAHYKYGDRLKGTYVVMYDPDFPENARLVMLFVPFDQRECDNIMVEVDKFLKEVDEQEAFIRGYGVKKS